MHVILKVIMEDVEKANDAITDGSLPRIIQNVSQMIKPEATYFYAEGGCRTGIFVFDLKDVSLIPQICEPFFMTLNARVEFYPTMNSDELKRGLEGWNKISSNYTSSSSSASLS